MDVADGEVDYTEDPDQEKESIEETEENLIKDVESIASQDRAAAVVDNRNAAEQESNGAPQEMEESVHRKSDDESSERVIIGSRSPRTNGGPMEVTEERSDDARQHHGSPGRKRVRSASSERADKDGGEERSKEVRDGALDYAKEAADAPERSDRRESDSAPEKRENKRQSRSRERRSDVRRGRSGSGDGKNYRDSARSPRRVREGRDRTRSADSRGVRSRGGSSRSRERRRPDEARTVRTATNVSKLAAPSKLLHVRGLPERPTVMDELEEELRVYGRVFKMLKMKFRGQALVEMESMEGADAIVNAMKQGPLNLRGSEVNISFSHAKAIGEGVPAQIVSRRRSEEPPHRSPRSRPEESRRSPRSRPEESRRSPIRRRDSRSPVRRREPDSRSPIRPRGGGRNAPSHYGNSLGVDALDAYRRADDRLPPKPKARSQSDKDSAILGDVAHEYLERFGCGKGVPLSIRDREQWSKEQIKNLPPWKKPRKEETTGRDYARETDYERDHTDHYKRDVSREKDYNRHEDRARYEVRDSRERDRAAVGDRRERERERRDKDYDRRSVSSRRERARSPERRAVRADSRDRRVVDRAHSPERRAVRAHSPERRAVRGDSRDRRVVDRAHSPERRAVRGDSRDRNRAVRADSRDRDRGVSRDRGDRGREYRRGYD